MSRFQPFQIFVDKPMKNCIWFHQNPGDNWESPWMSLGDASVPTTHPHRSRPYARGNLAPHIWWNHCIVFQMTIFLQHFPLNMFRGNFYKETSVIVDVSR